MLKSYFNKNTRKNLLRKLTLINVLIIVFLILYTSCTKELNCKLEDTKSLVINSVFNPKNYFTFNLSYTTSPLNSYDSINEKLHFLFYEENNLIIDTFLQSGILETNIRPIPNKEYKVEVLSDKLPSIITSDSIPNIVNIDKAILIYPAGVDEYGDFCVEAMITFTDPPQEENYYELLIYHLHKYDNEKNYWNWDGDVKITDPVLLNEGDVDYLPSSLFFSDELFNGETYTLKVKRGGYNTRFETNSGCYAELRSVSKSYYLYRKYYTRHVFNQQLQGEDLRDFIFMGEPRSMYTNVVNGYGIFAGYWGTTKELIYIK
ncbi:MAG: DUF4249 family protein [Bacteroidetes bacterium]|nr:DUF4249 family protein [Bacteroidota bacterium]